MPDENARLEYGVRFAGGEIVAYPSQAAARSTLTHYPYTARLLCRRVGEWKEVTS